MTFYPADLARIHDEGFGDFARAAACALLERRPAAGLVVELGCGSGISSQIFARNGYDVLGIDLSAEMLAIAQRRVPVGDFRQGSIWDAELPRCTAVTAIGEVINYAADQRAGAERLPGLFERVHHALQPGGLFMFDFALPGRGGGGPRVHEGRGWRVISEAIEDPASRTLERRMRIVAREHEREEIHHLRLYDEEAVRLALERAGFSCERLDRYCDFVFWSSYAAFAARKPC